MRRCPRLGPSQREEQALLEYAGGWDKHDKLVLADPGEIGEPYGLIAACKSEKTDRIVSDRRRQNAREAVLLGSSPT